MFAYVRLSDHVASCHAFAGSVQQARPIAPLAHLAGVDEGREVRLEREVIAAGLHRVRQQHAVRHGLVAGVWEVVGHMPGRAVVSRANHHSWDAWQRKAPPLGIY